MIDIDLTKLSESELHELNHKIVERLKFLHHVKAHHGMMQFNIGDRVIFEPHNSYKIQGVISKFNKKTVTIVSDDGGRWNVHPLLLKRAEVQKPQLQKNVIAFPGSQNVQGQVSRNGPCPCGSGKK